MKISILIMLPGLTTLLLTSCFSYKEIHTPQSHTFISGEVYKVYIKKDSAIRIKIEEASTTEIFGRVHRFDYSGEVDRKLGHYGIHIDSIVRLKKRKFSPLKTIGAVIETWLFFFLLSDNLDKVTPDMPIVI